MWGSSLTPFDIRGPGHVSLVIDSGISSFPKVLVHLRYLIPVPVSLRVFFRNIGPHDKSNQSQPRQPRSNIPTRICATTARVVAAGSPGAWACSHGHQEPRAPSTTRPPTTTATPRPRPDAALESTRSPRPPRPSRDPLPTPSASAPGSPRRPPQPSGQPRPPPSTPWPRPAP